MRRTAIDALRGVAICLMVVYHFCFDLRYFRVIAANFEGDPFWLGFRGLIVTSFLTLVGISLVLADRAGSQPADRAGSQFANRASAQPAHFWKRIGLIAACALAVSVGSYLMFPRSFIYFGILHCIAVTSIFAQPLLRRPRVALALGIAVILAGLFVHFPVFDTRELSWIGFMTHKPRTEDYAPLAPWAGVVFIGITIGDALWRSNFRALRAFTRTPAWLQWLGRHSLAVYMVHQPLLIGALSVVLRR